MSETGLNTAADIKEYFEKQLDRTNTWLSFAEAKNAGLIAANLAILSAIIEFFDEAPVICVISAVLVIISSLHCLLSFFPNLGKLRRRTNTNTVIGKRNLAFFGDISRFECQEQYVNKVIKDYFPQLRPEDVGNQVCDLAAEVLINSQITVQKYTWFKAALITDCLALATTIILFIAA